MPTQRGNLLFLNLNLCAACTSRPASITEFNEIGQLTSSSAFLIKQGSFFLQHLIRSLKLGTILPSLFSLYDIDADE